MALRDGEDFTSDQTDGSYKTRNEDSGDDDEAQVDESCYITASTCYIVKNPYLQVSQDICN